MRPRLIVAYLSGLIFASMAFSSAAGAYYNDQLGENQGYFNPSFRTGATGNNVLPAADNTCNYPYEGGMGNNQIPSNVNSYRMALPLDRVDTKAKYGGYLAERWRNNSCNGWDRLGVTFIVRTMLGHPPGSARDLTQADWDTFYRDIINNPNVGMQYLTTTQHPTNSHAWGFWGHAADDTKDVSFYNDPSPRQDPTLLFTGPSGYRYEIKLLCANPTGDMRTGVVMQPQWSASGGSRVRIGNGAAGTSVTAKPGDVLNWNHWLQNTGPSTTRSAINYGIARSGFQYGWNGLRVPSGSVTLSSGQFYRSGYGSGGDTSYTVYSVNQADVGKTLCQRIEWNPTAWNNSGGSVAGNACATVPYNYTLTPFISDTLPDVVEPEASYPVGSYVNRSGATISQSTQWQLHEIIVAPGQTPPQMAGGPSTSAPCGFYGGPGTRGCEQLQSGNQVFEPSRTDLTNYAANAEDTPPGTKICYGLSVKDRANNDTRWQHSAMRCVTIGKKPKLQVWGGDTAVRGLINTSSSTRADSTYGSWGEYGVLSVGANTGMASGAGLAEGADSNRQSDWSRLTFANVSSPFGRYAGLSSRQIPDVSRRLVTTSAQTGLAATVGDINSLNGTYSRGGNLRLEGGTLEKGKSVIIRVTGTVTIANDLKYTNDRLGSISEIPQLVIIAGNILIEDRVKQVDAWLVAPTGAINTCSNQPARLTASFCNESLRVNGPVIADKLLLRRTAGSGPGDGAGEPAETFNLRPDAYMWAQTRAGGSGRAQTVMTTELAPRF